MTMTKEKIVKPKPKKQKRPKKMELSQFQSWIDGICEMQEEEWCPTLEQWKLIKGTINLLLNDQIEYIDEVQQPIQYPVSQSIGPGIGNPIKNMQMPASTLDNKPIQPNLPVDTAKKIKQDIDTSDGNYESEFA